MFKEIGHHVAKRLLTVEEAAHYLGVSSRTIYNGCARRAKNPFPIRPVRVGRALRFDLQDLDRFIADSKE